MKYTKIVNAADTSVQYKDIREYEDTNDSIRGAYDNIISNLALEMTNKELEVYLSEQLDAKVTIKPNKGAK